MKNDNVNKKRKKRLSLHHNLIDSIQCISHYQWENDSHITNDRD